MQEAIIGKKFIFMDKKAGTGALPDPYDVRDFHYEPLALGAAPVDWNKGYDIETELNLIIPIKNQDGSSSCVGQGWSYYTGIIDFVENKIYDEVSAKAVYSQIALPGGGAYIREGAKLAVNWGSISEIIVPSYKNGIPQAESFFIDKSWKNDRIDKVAKVLQAKEYRTFDNSMDTIAAAIRDYHGVVGGVRGSNNGTWGSNEPKPPKLGESVWGHCIYFGKFGIDEKGKYIATPNSWGIRGSDKLHPDGWQKLREDYFSGSNIFNPWTLIDKPNFSMSPEIEGMMKKNEKKIVIEGEGAGRKGIIVNGELRQIIDKDNNRAAAACLYSFNNNGFGITVTTKMFNEMKKGDNF